MHKIGDFIAGLTIIISSIAALIVAILTGKKQVEDNLPQKIKKQSGIDVIIIQAMEDLKEYLNADCVQLYDFHNGGHYANGRSALKTTCTYEVVRSGIKPFQRLLQDIPLSCISRFTAKLLDDGFVEITDMESIKESMPSTYQLRTDMGIKSFYDITICNQYGEAIGFLTVQYKKNKYHCTCEEDKRAVLKLKFIIETELAKTGNK